MYLYGIIMAVLMSVSGRVNTVLGILIRFSHGQEIFVEKKTFDYSKNVFEIDKYCLMLSVQEVVTHFIK